MNPKCIELLTKAKGKPLTPQQIIDMERHIRDERINLHRKDENFKNLSDDVQLAMAVDAAKVGWIAEAIKKKQQVALTIKTKAAYDYVKTKMLNDGLTEMEAALQYFVTNAANKQTESLESSANAIAEIYKTKLRVLYDMNGGNLFNLFVSKTATEYFVRALHKEDVMKLAKTDAEIKMAKNAILAAEHYKSVTEESRQHFNEKGGAIGKLENYIMPQHWDMDAVSKFGEDNFVQFVKDRLDHKQYINENGKLMDDASLTKFLKEAFISISTNGMTRERAVGSSKTANKHKAHRQIFFRDADAWLDIHKEFSSAPMMHIVTSHIEGMGRDIALLEKLSPNPSHFMNQILDEAQANDAAKGVSPSKIAAQRKNLEKIYDFYTAGGQPVEKLWLANVGKTVRNLQIAKLGSIVIAQLMDQGLMLRVAKTLDIPAYRQAALTKFFITPEGREAAKRGGVALDMMNHHMSQFGESHNNYTWSGKLASSVMQLSGSHAMTQGERAVMGMMVQSGFADMVKAHKTLASIPEGRYKNFKDKLTEEEFAVMQEAIMEKAKTTDLITPTSIMSIPDERLRTILKYRVDTIRQDAGDVITNLALKDMQDAENLAKRFEKFDAYKDKIANLMIDYKAAREAHVADISDALDEKILSLDIKREQSEVASDIAKGDLAASQTNRTERFMDQVRKGIESYGKRRSEIGEKLGEKRRSIEEKIKFIERKLVKQHAPFADQKINEIQTWLNSHAENLGKKINTINKQVIDGLNDGKLTQDDVAKLQAELTKTRDQISSSKERIKEAITKIQKELKQTKEKNVILDEATSKVLKFAQSSNTFTHIPGKRAQNEGFTQPKGTPINELFSNWDSIPKIGKKEHASDIFSPIVTAERYKELMSEFRTKALDRASKKPIYETISATIRLSNGIDLVIEVTKPKNAPDRITLVKEGKMLAAARIQSGKIDTIASVEGGHGYGEQLLEALDKYGLANIYSVPDRSEGFVAIQRKVLERKQIIGEVIPSNITQGHLVSLKLLENRLLLEEASADMSSYIIMGKGMDSLKKFAESFDIKTQDLFGGRQFSEGEKLGYRQAQLEARLKFSEERLSREERRVGREIKGKDKELTKRINEREIELDEYMQRMTERAEKRNELSNYYQKEIGNKIDNEVKDFRRSLATKLLAIGIEETDNAILRPNIGDTVSFYGTESAGTYRGETWRIAAQFWMFPYIYTKRHFLERGLGQDGVVNQAKYMASMVSISLAFGALALMLDDLSNGKEPRDVLKDKDAMLKFAYKAMMRGGTFGLYGKAIEREGYSFGQGIAETYGGPGVGLISDTVTALQKTAKLVYDDDYTSEKYGETMAKTGVKLAKGLTPNFIYSKAAMDRLIWDDLNELANPGYKRRVTERARKDGSEYFWPRQ